MLSTTARGLDSRHSARHILTNETTIINIVPAVRRGCVHPSAPLSNPTHAQGPSRHAARRPVQPSKATAKLQSEAERFVASLEAGDVEDDQGDGLDAAELARLKEQLHALRSEVSQHIL